MDYLENTHCPNCFKPSLTGLCALCHFDRAAYLQQEAASHHLPVFSRLEKGYVLGRVLGEGSFAIVYAAIRDRDGLACAVKEYYPQDLAQRGLDGKTVNPKRHQEQLLNWQRRFEQEGELLRCCYDYPSVESGVVRYTALIKQHNTAYLVMERLVGQNLTALLANQPILQGEQICLWLKPLLETLQKLHGKEIYHRDISPNNIFLCAENDPVLMDFGLAREGARDGVIKSSTLGAGTFIAPEQLTGGYCDQRTDLYALGAVIYLCLHGQAPPPVEARRQGAPLGRLMQPNKLSLALQTIATHCLQLDLQMRPPNVGYLLAELSPYWLAPAIPSSLETLIPGLPRQPPYPTPATYAPSVAGDYIPARQTYPNPPPNRVATGLSWGKSLLKWTVGLGLAFVSFNAYQNYAEEQQKSQKQDRLLFAKAHQLADFKNYLVHCVLCESKQDAQNKIAELEQQQQAEQTQKTQKREERKQYIKAKTVDDLQAYLSECVICQYKEKAELELQKKIAQAQTQAQAEAAKTASEPSLWDALTQPAVEALESVSEEGKAQAQAQAEAKLKQEVDIKAQLEAETRARIESEYKAKADAEAAKLQSEAEIRAQVEADLKKEAEAKQKADAAAKQKADAELQKAQIEAEMAKIRAIGEAAVKVFGEPAQ